MGQSESTVGDTLNTDLLAGLDGLRVLREEVVGKLGDEGREELLSVRVPAIPLGILDDRIFERVTQNQAQHNAETGNIGGFLRFLSKCLYEYRTLDMEDPKRPSLEALGSLFEVARVLVKQIVERSVAPLILYHFEHLPIHPALSRSRPTNPEAGSAESRDAPNGAREVPKLFERTNGRVRLVYRGTNFWDVELPSIAEHTTPALIDGVLRWFREAFSQDLWVVIHRGFVFRTPQGRVFSPHDVELLKVVEASDFEGWLAVIPLGLPQPSTFDRWEGRGLPGETSTLREFFLESATFIFKTWALLLEDEPLCPALQQVHMNILEIFIIFFSVIVPPTLTSERQVPLKSHERPPPVPDVISGTGAVESPAPSLTSMAAHSAPLYYLFLQSQQPQPNIFCPTQIGGDGKSQCTPYAPLLEGFIESLALAQEYSRDMGIDIAKGFISALVNLMWLRSALARDLRLALDRSPDAKSRDDSRRSLMETHAGRSQNDANPSISKRFATDALSVLVVLIFHPAAVFGPSALGRHPALQAFGPPDEIVAMRRKVPEPEGGVELKIKNVCAEAFGELSDPAYFEGCDPQYGVFFTGLFASLCNSQRLSDHLIPMLLYGLVCRCRNFRVFTFSRVSPQQLVLPLLQLLHRIPEVCEQAEVETDKPKSSQPPYPAPPAATLLLLVLLILSRDTTFCKTLQEARLPRVPEWFGTPVQRRRLESQLSVAAGDRGSGDLSVGDMVLLVVLRFITWNFGHAKDLFVHEISGGVLCNLAASVTNLHWVLSDRVVEYLVMLCRQFLKRTVKFPTEAQANGKSPDSPKVEEGEECALPLLPYTVLLQQQQRLQLIRQKRLAGLQLSEAELAFEQNPNLQMDMKSQEKKTKTMTNGEIEVKEEVKEQEEEEEEEEEKEEEATKASTLEEDAEEMQRMIDAVDLPDEPEVTQAIALVLRSVLIFLSTALHPSKLKSKSSDASPEEILGSLERPKTSMENPLLLYALLRASSARRLLGELHEQLTFRVRRHMRRSRLLQYIAAYQAQYAAYAVYWWYLAQLEKQREENEDDDDDDVRRMLTYEEILKEANLPPHFPVQATQLSLRELPSIEAPPTKLSIPPDDPATVPIGFQTLPLSHYILDLVEFVEQELPDNEEGTETETLSIEQVLQRLEKRCKSLPDSTEAEKPSAGVEALGTPEERLRAFAALAPPMGFSFEETPDSCHYFQPLIWKTLFYLQPADLCWAADGGIGTSAATLERFFGESTTREDKTKASRRDGQGEELMEVANAE